MSDIIQQVKSVLTLDGRQPNEVLKELANRAEELKTEMGQALNAGDKKQLDALYKEWNKNEKKINSVTAGIFDLKKVLDSLSTASLKDLRKAKMQINSELDKMTRGTDEYIAKSKELKSVNAELKKIGNETSVVAAKQESFFGKMSNGFNKYFGVVTAIGASFAGVVFSARKAVDAFNEYEATVDNLGAITGLAGEELEWLSNKAKETATSTIEGSIKITQSSKDIVDAYKTMGSARPELLKNKEDLAKVTQEALILAEASKMETAPAIDAVAASMNQFNLGADQSRRIINALAAGSLEGSAEVADLTESLKNVGTVADGSNMTLEQTVAALEVLGEKQLKGAEAGTKLRGAILKMKEAGVGYQSGAFNMRDALEEVNIMLSKQGSELEKDALKQKIFGTENQTVGNILIQNIDKYDKLTVAVTGTDTAIVQATKNTDNNASSLEQAKNEAYDMSVALGEKLAPAMVFSTNVFSKFLRVLVGSIEFYKNHSRIINTVVVGLVAYYTAVKASLVWDKLKVFWTDKVTGSVSNLFKTIKADPWGILISGIAMAITYFTQLEDKVIELTDAQKKLNETQEKSADIFANTKTIEERMQIISSLNRRQIEQLKQDIETQISMNEDFNSELLAQAKERISRDQEIAKLNADYNFAISKKQFAIAAGIATNITHRKEEIIADLEVLNQKHQTSLQNLTKDLQKVSDVLSKMPSENKTGPGETEEQRKKREAAEKKASEEKLARAKHDADLLNQIEEDRLDELAKITAEWQKEQDDAEKAAAEEAKLKADEAAGLQGVLDIYGINLDQYKQYLADRKSADESYFNWLIRKEAETQLKKVEKWKNGVDLVNQIAQASGQVVTNLMDMELEKAGENEEKKKEIRKKYSDIEFVMTAAQIVSNTASAMIAALAPPPLGLGPVFGPIVAGIAAATGATQLLVSNEQRKRVKQLAGGKYDVIGEQTGKTYSANYAGSVKTGLYSKPTLAMFGEEGPEIVTDGQTTKTLMLHYPEAIQAIQYARAGIVPQHASGYNMPVAATNQNVTVQIDPYLANAMNNFAKALQKPISAEVSLKHFLEKELEYNTIQSDVSQV